MGQSAAKASRIVIFLAAFLFFGLPAFASDDPNLTNSQTDVSVQASDTFYTLTVLKDGTGGGTVSGGGVNCGAVCAASSIEQTPVSLSAAPDGQSIFSGWSGSGCSGKGPCEILMDGNKTVTAVFNLTIGSVMLPKTGVMSSYAPGDDGALRRGVAWPDPRFTFIYCNDTGPCANQNADCDWYEPLTRNDVVIDHLTGLMWFRDGNYFDWGANGSTLPFVVYNIQNWFNVPNDSGYNICGYYDWRLPNVNEMASLLNPGQAPGWLNSRGFVDIKRQYWTSTTSAYSPTEGLYVDLGGSIFSTDKDHGSRPFFMLVRDTLIKPVLQVPRTGQTTCYDDNGNIISCAGTGQDGEFQKGVSAPGPRFANPNGTAPANQNVVLDRLTHLMWTRDAYLPGEIKLWQGALDYVAGLNSGSGYGGYTDWRLPNLFELRSLQDYSQSSPALPPGHPFLNVLSGSIYWTSDTVYGSPTDAWTVGIDGYMGGAFGTNIKADEPRWVWPVRGGAPNAAPGDLNLDGSIDLTDAIIALQVMSGISTLNQSQMSYADVDQDGRIGLPEAIYVLQEVAGLR